VLVRTKKRILYMLIRASKLHNNPKGRLHVRERENRELHVDRFPMFVHKVRLCYLEIKLLKHHTLFLYLSVQTPESNMEQSRSVLFLFCHQIKNRVALFYLSNTE
jgi:hypothetical protein